MGARVIKIVVDSKAYTYSADDIRFIVEEAQRAGQMGGEGHGGHGVPVFSRKGPGIYRSIPPRVRRVTCCF